MLNTELVSTWHNKFALLTHKHKHRAGSYLISKMYFNTEFPSWQQIACLSINISPCFFIKCLCCPVCARKEVKHNSVILMQPRNQAGCGAMLLLSCTNNWFRFFFFSMQRTEKGVAGRRFLELWIRLLYKCPSGVPNMCICPLWFGEGSLITNNRVDTFSHWMVQS